jgi:hypothetical protein
VSSFLTPLLLPSGSLRHLACALASELVALLHEVGTRKCEQRWGGAVFFISNRVAEARGQLDWYSDRVRAAQRRKAKDAVDMRLASRLVGEWGGAEGAQSLRDQIHERGTKPPKPDYSAFNARLAVATLEGRLNYLLATGGASARSAVGLAALLDARGWSGLSVLVACSGLVLPAIPKVDPEAQARAWLDELAHDAVRGLVQAWAPVEPPKLGFAGAADHKRLAAYAAKNEITTV